jgi:hypothetical protein
MQTAAEVTRQKEQQAKRKSKRRKTRWREKVAPAIASYEDKPAETSLTNELSLDARIARYTGIVREDSGR